MMCIIKKKALRRISVWTLIFALLLTVLSASMLSVHAENFLGDAARDVGDAVSDAGHAVSDALDMNGADGAVNDSDGIIGNESAEAPSTDDVAKEDGNSGWIGLAIAILIVVIAVVLIILLIPKKKDKK
ncbi:MAG: hypothetical protein IKA44_04705 [Clostridia bacterium]|nr:hypothetical protein [Clostridia bacterium]